MLYWDRGRRAGRRQRPGGRRWTVAGG